VQFAGGGADGGLRGGISIWWPGWAARSAVKMGVCCGWVGGGDRALGLSKGQGSVAGSLWWPVDAGGL